MRPRREQCGMRRGANNSLPKDNRYKAFHFSSYYDYPKYGVIGPPGAVKYWRNIFYGGWGSDSSSPYPKIGRSSEMHDPMRISELLDFNRRRLATQYS